MVWHVSCRKLIDLLTGTRPETEGRAGPQDVGEGEARRAKVGWGAQ